MNIKEKFTICRNIQVIILLGVLIMKNEHFSFVDIEGKDIYVYKWVPLTGNIKGAIQIAHGLSETAGRYERFAEILTDRGYIVYANDHRGHGNTAGDLANLGYAGEDGFNLMIENMKQLNEIIKSENNNIPVFLLGHSMGSHLSQVYITRYGNTLNGVILSGTSGKQGFILNMGIFLAKRGIKKSGVRARAYNINKLSFGGFNKEFSPNRTEFDWLSRDEKEVDKYVNDDYCGAVPTYGFFYDYFKGFKVMHDKINLEKIPKQLPIYLYSGEKDPVGGDTKSVLNLIELYKEQEIKDITYKFYKDGRHEMLNELNKDEVMNDVANWIDSHIK